jgi:predicted RNA-binding protein with PUA domain
MDNTGCNCSNKASEMTCRINSRGEPLPYWCETCQQLVADKRCPGCGLKSRKVRQAERSGVKI